MEGHLIMRLFQRDQRSDKVQRCLWEIWNSALENRTRTEISLECEQPFHSFFLSAHVLLNLRLEYTCLMPRLRKCSVMKRPLHSRRRRSRRQNRNISNMISFLFFFFPIIQCCWKENWGYTLKSYLKRLVISLRFISYPYRGALHIKPTHREDTSSMRH